MKVHFFLCLFNFIFCKVLEENPDVSKKLLEMLLNIKIDRIEKTCSEYSLKQILILMVFGLMST